MRKSVLWLAGILLIVFSCAKKPPELENPSPQDLYQKVVEFYDFLRNKDLDSFAYKLELQAKFQDQEHFYAFLDTILPAMWERNFERNRILDYQILSLELEPSGDSAWVEVWILSDDTLPFGKVMTFKHRWYQSYFTWYPAEIKAPKPTLWEKYR